MVAKGKLCLFISIYIYIILKTVCCWYTNICFIYFLLVFLHKDEISVDRFSESPVATLASVLLSLLRKHYSVHC